MPDVVDDTLDILSESDAWLLFESDARRLLGVSSEEFVRRWDAGAYAKLGEETVKGRRTNETAFSLLTVSSERADAERLRQIREGAASG